MNGAVIPSSLPKLSDAVQAVADWHATDWNGPAPGAAIAFAVDVAVVITADFPAAPTATHVADVGQATSRKPMPRLLPATLGVQDPPAFLESHTPPPTPTIAQVAPLHEIAEANCDFPGPATGSVARAPQVAPPLVLAYTPETVAVVLARPALEIARQLAPAQLTSASCAGGVRPGTGLDHATSGAGPVIRIPTPPAPTAMQFVGAEHDSPASAGPGILPTPRRRHQRR